MPAPLLDRQVKLIDFLSSAAAVFGEPSCLSVDPELRGINHRLLCLEARFAHDKRMAKIATVLPNTLELIKAGFAAIALAFVEANPATSIGRLDNARQFHNFLCANSQKQLFPPYLLDVSACEIACAQVRVEGARRDVSYASGLPITSVRRNSSAVLLRCHHDIRSIFEGYLDGPSVIDRETLLGVSIPLGAQEPQVFELSPNIFDTLSMLEQWTDPDALAPTSEREELTCELLHCGLIEVRH